MSTLKIYKKGKMIMSVIGLILFFSLVSFCAYAEESAPIAFTPSITESVEGSSTSIKIYVENGKCASDMTLSLNDILLVRSFLSDGYVKFKIPSDIAPGNYDLKLVNDGIAYELGTFTVNALPPEPDCEFVPASMESNVGKRISLKIYAQEGECNGDMTLSMGGQQMKSTFICASYGKFTIPASLPAGEYEMIVTNKGKVYDLGIYKVKDPDAVPDLSAFTSSITEATAGDGTSIKIYVKNATFKSDTRLTFGGIELPCTFVCDSYAKFKIPKTLPYDDYEMVITNNGNSYPIGVFHLLEKDPPPPPTFISFDVDSSEMGENQTVNIMVNPDNVYAADFGLFLDLLPLSINSSDAHKITVTVPDTTPVGKYKLQALNKGKYIVIGDYEVVAPPPDPIFTGLDPASGYEESSHTVRILADTANIYHTDLAVSIDGNPIAFTQRSNKSLEITLPADTAVGTYAVAVTNRRKTIPIGNFEVKAIPEPVFLGLEPSSGEEESSHNVKILADPSNIYHPDLAVYFDAVQVSSRVSSDKSLSFTVPKNVAVGTYAVEVYNRGIKKKVGDFEVTPIPDPEYLGLEPASGFEGSTHKVQIKGKSTNNYGKDLAVYFDGNMVSASAYSDKSISFEVPSTALAGTYTVEVLSRGKRIAAGDFEVKPIPDPTFTTFSRASCQEGEGATVRLSADPSNMYAGDTAIYFNDRRISLTQKGADFLEFTVPTDLAPATYDVKVYNRGKYIPVTEKFTITPEPYIIKVSSIDKTSTIEGKSVTVKVTSSQTIAYMDIAKFKVFLNDTEVAVKFTSDYYFKFAVPASLPVGNYTIKVQNELITKPIGIFSVTTPPPVPDPVYDGLDGGTYTAGKSVKVTLKNANYGSDFTVLVGDIAANVSFMCDSYFKFTLPKTLVSGNDYTVIVKNNGKTTDLGSIRIS